MMIKIILLFILLSSCGVFENKHEDNENKKTTQTTIATQTTETTETITNNNKPDYSDLTLEIKYINTYRNSYLMTAYNLIVKGGNISDFTHYRVISGEDYTCNSNCKGEKICLNNCTRRYFDDILEKIKKSNEDSDFGYNGFAYFDTRWQKIEKQYNTKQLLLTLILSSESVFLESNFQLFLKGNHFKEIKGLDNIVSITTNIFPTDFIEKAKPDFTATNSGNIIIYQNKYYLINCNGALISENLNKWTVLQLLSNKIINFNDYYSQIQDCKNTESIISKGVLITFIDETVSDSPGRGELYQRRTIYIKNTKAAPVTETKNTPFGSPPLVVDDKIYFLGGAKIVITDSGFNSHLESISDIAYADLDLDHLESLKSEIKFSERSYLQVYKFHKKYWIMGGIWNSDFAPYLSKINDIWSSSDLINWEKVVDKLPFDANENKILAIFNDQIWTIKSGKIWHSLNGEEWLKFDKWEFLKNEQLINLFSENNKIHVFIKIDDKYFHYQAGTDFNLGKKVEIKYE